MNADLPAVSVIMPAYNNGKFLREAVESVLGQERVELELIVVDGNSADDTQAVAESFGSRIRYFRTGPDNVSIAKNFAIPLARHPLIAFMSADDIWFPDKLRKQAELLAAHPGVSVCICKVRYFLDPGCEWPANFPERQRTGDFMAPICETLFARREVFSTVGLFDASLGTSEDVDWFARANAAAIGIAQIPETLMLKRVHDHNTSLTRTGGKGELMRVLHDAIHRKKSKPTP